MHNVFIFYLEYTVNSIRYEFNLGKKNTGYEIVGYEFVSFNLATFMVTNL